MAGSVGQFYHHLGIGWRVQELFRMTNIWNGNNSEGMTLISNLNERLGECLEFFTSKDPLTLTIESYIESYKVTN